MDDIFVCEGTSRCSVFVKGMFIEALITGSNSNGTIPASLWQHVSFQRDRACIASSWYVRIAAG